VTRHRGTSTHENAGALAPAVAEGATLVSPGVLSFQALTSLIGRSARVWRRYPASIGAWKGMVMTTPVVKVTEIQNGFELVVQEPISVRAILLRDGDGAWSLDTIDAIDGFFPSERYVVGEIVDQPLDLQECARRERSGRAGLGDRGAATSAERAADQPGGVTNRSGGQNNSGPFCPTTVRVDGPCLVRAAARAKRLTPAASLSP